MSGAEIEMLAAIELNKLSGTPAEEIIKRSGNELWLYAYDQKLLAKNLCKNVYWFGRNGADVWVWDAGSGGNPTGEALARGVTKVTNCGGFNTTVRWIGQTVLKIPSTDFTGSFTLANEYFITLPGTQGIDRNWHGNVRTLTQDFPQVQAYFFMGHSWSNYKGNMLDASTNMVDFQEKTQLYWCTLAITNRPKAEIDGRAFMVTKKNSPYPIPGAGPYACVSTKSLKRFQHLFPIVAAGIGGQVVTQSFIKQLPNTTGNNWETFVLVSRDHLSNEYRRAVNLP